MRALRARAHFCNNDADIGHMIKKIMLLELSSLDEAQAIGTS